VFRVLLFLLLFTPSVFARIGESYADFAKRAGEALEDHPDQSVKNRLALHKDCGRYVWSARSFYPECEAELRYALAVTPDAVGLQDTLAGLLAECGREEAVPLLRATFRRADHEVAIGISAAYLSVLAQKKGRARESAKYRKRAIEFLSADHPLLQRLFRTPEDPIAKLVCAC
jgi:hypothetical protein